MMRGAFLLLLFTLIFCGSPSSNAGEKRSFSGVTSEIFKPETEVASIEKTVTNLIQALDEPEEAAPPSAAFQFKVSLVVALILVGLLAFRRFSPKIAESLNAKYAAADLAPADDISADQQAIQKFATVFTSRSVGSNYPQHSSDASSESNVKAQSGENLPKNNCDPLAEFLRTAREKLETVGTLFSQISRAPDEASREKLLCEISETISALKVKAALPAVAPILQMCTAVEGLLNQLKNKSSNVTPSTLRTVASAIDLLKALCVPGLKPNIATAPPVRLLAVDDDAIGRHAISFALKKVFGAPDLAVDGETALVLANEHSYDVIFLDVEMPGMDGFELCSKVHETVTNGTTPVVFVTRHSDLDARAKSSIDGGHDLIGKPFVIFEVAVKALTIVLRRRLQTGKGVADLRSSRAHAKVQPKDVEAEQTIFVDAADSSWSPAVN